MKIAGYYSGWALASWISPSGEEFDTKGETHQGWIFNNRDFVERETGLFSEIETEIIEEHNDYILSEINRIKEELSESKDYDYDEEYINKLKEDLQFYEDAFDKIDLDNINVSQLVNKLIGKGWVRKLDKHGILHYEFAGESSIKLIENNLLENISKEEARLKEYTPIILEDLLNFGEINFELGEWLKSGKSLLEWLKEDTDKYRYNKYLGAR